MMYHLRMKMRSTMLNHPITNSERLAADLKSLRCSRKVSQALLASRAAVSRRTITNAEAAENIGVKELCKLVNSLGYELVLRPKDTVVFEELATIFKDEE
jgi:DNA-binding XRE family transcriptional regulator